MLHPDIAQPRRLVVKDRDAQLADDELDADPAVLVDALRADEVLARHPKPRVADSDEEDLRFAVALVDALVTIVVELGAQQSALQVRESRGVPRPSASSTITSRPTIPKSSSSVCS